MPKKLRSYEKSTYRGVGAMPLLTRHGASSRPFESSSVKLFMDQPESIERLRWYAYPNWKKVIPNSDVTIIDQGTSWTAPWVTFALSLTGVVLFGIAFPLKPQGYTSSNILISAAGMKRLAGVKPK